MRPIKKLSLVCVLVVAGTMYSSAQTLTNYFEKFRPAKRWSVGLQVSPTHASGEADDYRVGWAFGMHTKYSVGQSFGLRLDGNIGTLNGSRENQDIGGNGGRYRFDPLNADNTTTFNEGNQAPLDDSYFFRNNFKDLSLTMHYTLGNISFLRPLRKYQVFFFTGIGAIWSDAEGRFDVQADAERYYERWGDQYFTPEYDNNGNLTNAVSNYKGMNMTIPFGVGMKRDMGKWLDLGLTYRSHFARTDNLDAFSFPLWRNRVMDMYGMLSVQASIKLGGKDGIEAHYDWLNPVESIYETLDSLQTIQAKVDLLLKDTDGDGVADYYDQEPNTEKGAYVWGNGATADIDQDGVPDNRDAEPYSEKGSIVDANGVMIDVDNDGVPDYRDEDTKTSPNEIAHPKTGVGVKLGACCNCDDIVLPAVVFDNGSTQIKPEFYGALYNAADKMRSCPDVTVSLVGYAAKGKSGSILAGKRANAIIDYMNETYNIPKDRFKVDASNRAPAGLEYSGRRIDLKKAE